MVCSKFALDHILIVDADLIFHIAFHSIQYISSMTFRKFLEPVQVVYSLIFNLTSYFL